MIPEAENQLAETSSVPPALKPPVQADALLYRELLEGPFWQRIPAYAGISEAEFLDHGWQAQTVHHQPGQASGRPQRPGLGGIPAGRRGRLPAGSDVGAGIALPALPDRLAEPLRRPAAIAVHSGRVAAPSRPPQAGSRLAPRAQGHAGARSHAPLPGQGAVPGPRHLPGLLPLLYPLVRGRNRHRGGDQVPSPGQSRALASDLCLHRLAARARGHRHLRRRRVPASSGTDHPHRRVPARHPARAPVPLRHQGTGGDAAEDSHRPRLDRRPDPHRRQGSHACTRKWSSTPTSIIRTKSRRSPRRPRTSYSDGA